MWFLTWLEINIFKMPVTALRDQWGACIPHDSSEVVICSELKNGEELFLSTKKLTPGLSVGV